MVEPKSGWGRVVERMGLLQLLTAQARKERHGISRTVDRALGRRLPPRGNFDRRRLASTRINRIGRQPEVSRLAPNGQLAGRTGASLTVIGKSLHRKSPASTAVYARLDLEIRSETLWAGPRGLCGRPLGCPPSASTTRRGGAPRRRPVRSGNSLGGVDEVRRPFAWVRSNRALYDADS